MRTVLVLLFGALAGAGWVYSLVDFPNPQAIETCRVITKYSRMAPVDPYRPTVYAEASKDGHVWKALHVTLDSVPHLIRFRRDDGVAHVWTDNVRAGR